MTWTYSGDPAASDKDKLRYLIGDTMATHKDQSDQYVGEVTDEELAYVISTYPSDDARLAALYNALAGKFASTGVNRRLGPQSEDSSDKYTRYLSLARKYERRLASRGIPLTKDAPIVFKIGMFDTEGGNLQSSDRLSLG